VQSTTPSAAPRVDVQVEQDPLADVGVDKGVDEVVDEVSDKGSDKGADELSAEAVEEGVTFASPTHVADVLQAYVVNSDPSVLALGARVPQLRAQVVALLQELDDFQSYMPKLPPTP
jgi:hypothetical protein